MNTKIVIGVLTVAVMAAFILTKNEVKADDIALMTTMCEHSYNAHNGNLEELCGGLIDSVQSQGFEVLQKDGKFWAESK